MQKHDKAYAICTNYRVVWWKDANCVADAEIYMAVYCCQCKNNNNMSRKKNNTIEIDL